MRKIILLIVGFAIFSACSQTIPQAEIDALVEQKVQDRLSEIEQLEQRNMQSIKGLLAAFGSGNTDHIDDFIDPEFINHMAPEGLQDRAGFHEIVKRVNSAFSLFESYKVEPAHIFSKGDYVAMMDIGHGVKNGEAVNHTDIHLFKMRDGRLLEHWNSFNLPSQGVQLQKFLQSTK